MDERITLATATGLPFIALAFHVATGAIAFVAGTVAITARKGGQWHRQSGLLFTASMVASGLSAVGIALYEGKPSAGAGAFAAYYIVTAWTTIRPLPGGGRNADVALMALAFVFAAAGLSDAFTALGRPGRHLDGVPAGMLFFLNGVMLLAAVGDLRMVRSGRPTGARRLARHLWRMSFGLFIATGSFVAQLVEMAFMPAWMRSVPVILALAAGPLVLLAYWMWRVRLRQNLRGLITAQL